MSNVIFTGGRLVVLLSVLLLAETPARCQFGWDGNPYDASQNMRYAVPAPFGVTAPAYPVHQPSVSGGTVSADTLRHPLSAKARRALERALHQSELGNHTTAMERLREAMVEYPRAAPYTLTLLGAELVEARQYTDAVDAFEQDVRTMPHLSAAHSNLGLSLALIGNADAAERELRQALVLDHGNSKARHILEAVLVSQRRSPQPTAAGLTPLP